MKSVIYLTFSLFLLVGLAYALFNSFQQEEAIKTDASTDSLKIKLQKEVAAIFKKHCVTSGCHKGTYPKKKLNLEEDKFFEAIVNIPSRAIDSFKLVDTKNPQKSYLLMKVRGDKGIVDDRMPIEAPPLKDQEIKIIEDWISRLAEIDKPQVKEAGGKSKQ